MWVVKIGGSLNHDPLLPQWLALLAQLGGGRVTLVCGGGSFADEVRRTQSHWRFDDLAAHNMAVLAMTQSAYLAHALQPALRLARDQSEIRAVLRGGQVALWLPCDWLRERGGADTGWDTSSDSIALDLARQLNAERLVVVKSCTIAPHASLAELGHAGVLDARFAATAAGANFPIDLVHRAELARMRSLLIGEPRPPA
ncbi:aspartate kinase [Piscinibacter sp.]|uniref:amino acid kinase family protein n=1 Tax=Piscinibacter sp. TaxID=1903157 RepID=UPI0039E520EF